MKNTLLLGLIFIFFCLNTFNINAQQEKSETEFSIENTIVSAQFTITGMASQEGCANAIKNKLTNLKGVHEVMIRYKENLGVVLFDKKIVSIDTITSTVKKTKVKNYTYNVENIEIK